MASSKDKLVAGAQKLVERGQFDRAIKEYLRVVAQDPKDVRIWLKIGDLYAKLNKQAEAAETYQKVAAFYSDQGFYLKSVAVYKQILRIQPQRVEINQRLAELYQQLGLLSDAMAQFDAIVAFYEKEGNTAETIAVLLRILEIEPQAVAYRIKLAELYSKDQKRKRAIEEFTRAADQLREAKRTDDFMKVAERLLFIAPENRAVTKEVARLYIQKNDPRRALPKLQICFKADPRDSEVLSLLARAFEGLDQRQKAVSVLKELARVLGENGDHTGRDDAYRKILILEPNDAEAQTALGRAPRRPAPPEAALSAMPTDTGPQTAWRSRDEPPPEARQNPTGGRALEPELISTHIVAPNPLADATIEPLTAVSEPSGSEPIAKILSECDVYIKYNLHHKAIEHLQHVFERQPNHVEAREKLKALYLIVGHRDKAILELWLLAEHAGPGHARRYLREILELDPSNARARHMLGEPAAAGPTPTNAGADGAASLPELGDIDDIEELSSSAIELTDAPEDPSGTIDVSLFPELEEGGRTEAIKIGAAEAIAEADDDIPLVVMPAGRGTKSAQAVEVEDRFGLDEDEAADDTPAQPARPAKPEQVADAPGGSLQELAANTTAALPGTSVSVEVDDDDLPPINEFDAPQATPIAELPEPKLRGADKQGASGTTSLQDELDEAEFFVQQNLFQEARSILESLEQRHPRHPLVIARLRDLDVVEHAASLQTPLESLMPPEPAAPEMLEPASPSGQPTVDLVAPAVLHGGRASEPAARGVIEKGVGPEDFDTHYDLGIAYREMGLLDDAIAEFRRVMRDPARQVQCHMMIGLCQLAKGMPADAIGEFKKGLYVESITDREALSLYYELGLAYEGLSDSREALYYYDKVVKRDAQFRDVDKRVRALREAGDETAVPSAAQPSVSDDVDSGFDTLLGDRTDT